jgi:hypothetical protein
VTFRKVVFSWRLWSAALLLPLTIAMIALWPLPGRANLQVAPEPNPRLPSKAVESWLIAHGLMSGGMSSASSKPGDIVPVAGVEIDEARQFVTGTGQELMRMKSWREPVGGDTIQVELTYLPSGQYTVGYWVFGNHSRGCAMFSWTLYDRGRPLKSNFWRNDPELHLAGAAKLPTDLYPESIPGNAFLRAIGELRPGARGKLHQQLTPYSYVDQDVSATNVETVHVPAGDFSAIRVTAQADVRTLMPNWPGFVLRIIRPFVPGNAIYFESSPPYRLLKEEGTTFVGGPEVTTELVRYYVSTGAPSATAHH